MVTDAEKDFYIFPAVRGIQAARPCYLVMCPMRLVAKIFSYDSSDIPPYLRAQRTLHHQRIPDITSYLLKNPLDYTLSALTVSVDAMVSFAPVSDTGFTQNVGTLAIPKSAKILINDGQHRRAAIAEAIKLNPELGHENVPVLFFIDQGLHRSQQMFADLNKYAVRPSDSLSTLYDLRDSMSDLARYIQNHVSLFNRMTEMEKSSISNRSTKLVTLSSIKNASKALLRKKNKELVSMEEKELAVEYWEVVAANMPDWQMALKKEVAPAALRNDYIHAHGVMLQAMGQIGADLLTRHRNDWKTILQGLGDIDWSRSNPAWEGRAMISGRISKAHINVMLTGNYIKQRLNISLNPIEAEAEKGVKT